VVPVPDRPVVWKPLEVTPPPAASRSDLPAELQTRVNQAINGTWGRSSYSLAMTALGGLTLVELGVPRNDERVQRAARYVRERALRDSHQRHTYSVSLVVLFLDSLQAPEDRPLLRTLALRLLAGQRHDGGWSYDLPTLTPSEEKQLLHALSKARPPELARLLRTLEESRPLERITEKPEAPATETPAEKRPALSAEQELRQAVALLPERLQRLPGLSETKKDPPPERRLGEGRLGEGRLGEKRKPPKVVWANTDNSNTQFAILALWAALRQGVPTEHALRRVAERFQDTQAKNGRWGYRSFSGDGTPAMTGVGLLGLGVGHGLSSPLARQATDDPQIQAGLTALGKLLHHEEAKNLYFLWTLERVGVLYSIPTIGERDWYRHAVETLLPQQRKEGSWEVGGYHGSGTELDTFLALLILKRTNFVPELTRTLRGGLIRDR
jgi:hypothetical protein